MAKLRWCILCVKTHKNCCVKTHTPLSIINGKIKNIKIHVVNIKTNTPLNIINGKIKNIKTHVVNIKAWQN
jgi:hypothetical protein